MVTTVVKAGGVVVVGGPEFLFGVSKWGRRLSEKVDVRLRPTY